MMFPVCPQELPGSGLGLERELDEIVPVLLKKAGDLSTAGEQNTRLLTRVCHVCSIMHLAGLCYTCL